MDDSFLQNITSKIKSNDLRNEAAVSLSIVLPIIQELGWNIHENSIVKPEYSLSGRRVDYALCFPQNKPIVFIEVKQKGSLSGADKQLFEYAFHEGIPLAILTDGQQWHFYLPSGQGDYQDRRFYLIDILERNIDEVKDRLIRYLSYSRIVSGEALKSAHIDYEDASKEKLISQTFRNAWKEIVEGPDEFLIEIISEKVTVLCGSTPTHEMTINFIRKHISSIIDDVRPETTTSEQDPMPTGQDVRWQLLRSKAIGIEIPHSRKFKVLKGAIALSVKQSLTGNYLDIRKDLESKGIIRKSNQGYELTRDYEFASKAQATNVILGVSESAPRAWRKI